VLDHHQIISGLLLLGFVSQVGGTLAHSLSPKRRSGRLGDPLNLGLLAGGLFGLLGAAAWFY